MARQTALTAKLWSGLMNDLYPDRRPGHQNLMQILKFVPQSNEKLASRKN